MEQKIQLICNMTTYDESKARERLEALGGDSEKVIREFMNEGRDKTENEQTNNKNKEVKKDINQEIYSSIRTFMNKTKIREI